MKGYGFGFAQVPGPAAVSSPIESDERNDVRKDHSDNAEHNNAGDNTSAKNCPDILDFSGIEVWSPSTENLQNEQLLDETELHLNSGASCTNLDLMASTASANVPTVNSQHASRPQSEPGHVFSEVPNSTSVGLPPENISYQQASLFLPQSLLLY